MYVLIGPHLGIGITGKTIYRDDDEAVGGVRCRNDELKRLDYGLTVGAGWKSSLLSSECITDLGWQIFHHIPKTVEAKNRVLGLSLGYKFGAKAE